MVRSKYMHNGHGNVCPKYISIASLKNKKDHRLRITTKTWPSLQSSRNRKSKFLPIKLNIALVFNQWSWSIIAFKLQFKEISNNELKYWLFFFSRRLRKWLWLWTKTKMARSITQSFGLVKWWWWWWLCYDYDDFGQMMKMVVIIMRNNIILCCLIIWDTRNTKF